LRLICYPTSGPVPKIVPAPVERHWMDQTEQGYAYRCLPLNIANAHGWMILNPVAFSAIWDGGQGLDAIKIDAEPSTHANPALSHFGTGILTFHVSALFRTEPGYDLMATGPLNQPKDAIQPLTGIVETDWSPLAFTMNWKFTRPYAPIVFARDEPFCMIFPLKRGFVEEVEPEIRSLESDPDIETAYRTMADARLKFNEGLKVPGSEAQAEKWQKNYMRGSTPFGNAPPDHRTKLALKPFRPAE
jgi:hypothetical protein